MLSSGSSSIMGRHMGNGSACSELDGCGCFVVTPMFRDCGTSVGDGLVVAALESMNPGPPSDADKVVDAVSYDEVVV